MSRRNHLMLVAATLVAALAACASPKPITSVGALSYPGPQGQSAGPASDRFAGGSTPTSSVAQPSAPVEGSTNDPMFRLDMP